MKTPQLLEEAIWAVSALSFCLCLSKPSITLFCAHLALQFQQAMRLLDEGGCVAGGARLQ